MGLRTTYQEDPELFEESCNTLLSDLSLYQQDSEIRENIFCALGNSMIPVVEYRYPNLWRNSWALFLAGLNNESLGEKAEYYLECMIHEKDPLERDNEYNNEVRDQAIDYYISPALLEKNEKLFERGFNGVCKRLKEQYKELTGRIKSGTYKEGDNAMDESEIEKDIFTLLGILHNCMTCELEESRPDLHDEGMDSLKGLSSYNMTLTLGQIPGTKMDVPESFKKITQKAIEIGISKTLSREYQQE
jgi:hypothetical protein